MLCKVVPTVESVDKSLSVIVHIKVSELDSVDENYLLQIGIYVLINYSYFKHYFNPFVLSVKDVL